LSLRRTSQRLSCYIRRNHVSVWNWIQRYKPQRISTRSKKILEYIIDETLLKVGSEYVWLWVATIEPENRQILALSISKERKKHVCCGTLSIKYCT
jgi:putative transposase